MFAANTYHIRLATDQDTDKLHGLAQRNSQQPLSGRVLIGEIAGVGAAALSLSDGRVVADSPPRIGNLVANLRVRAVSIWAQEATPSLHDRLLAGLPAWYRAMAMAAPASTSDDQSVEHEPVLVSA